ncbi:hypothetical protein RQP46_007254 [Phenoliferia psychrophenolica]
MLAVPALVLAALAAVAPAAAQLELIAPSMGTACNYMVFGTSAITTGATGTYDGTFGISPTTIDAVTIPPGLSSVPTQDYWTARPQVFGLVHGPGASADNARADYLAAYEYANTLAPTQPSPSIVLGGLTFDIPGVYHWSTPAYSAASSTINIVGALGDVYIFQVNTLTTGAFSKVVLSGGIQADSIFWILESTLTLGASSEFYGIAMCGTAATVGASVKWVGAVFAKSAVTMGDAVEMTDGNGLCAGAAAPAVPQVAPTVAAAPAAPVVAPTTAAVAAAPVVAPTPAAPVVGIPSPSMDAAAEASASLTPSGAAAAKARRAALEAPRWDRVVAAKNATLDAGRRSHIITRAAHGSKRAIV